MPEVSEFYGLTLGTDISADEIKSALGATAVRVSPPGTALTDDYIPTRITIYVTAKYVIKKIKWG